MAPRNSARTSPGNERFSTVPGSRLPRSAFDLSYNHSTTMDAGYLVPIYREELLPGDVLSVRPTFFARILSAFAKVPVTGVHIDYQFFACPTRLLWENWVRMHGERTDPADHIDYTVPQISAPAGTGYLAHDVGDYLGPRIGIPDLTHTALYHRLYNLIFQEWYRDESLTDAIVIETDDGPDSIADYPLLKRRKRKDYLTGALPFAQKGDPVSLPLGISAPVVSTQAQLEFETATDASAPFESQSAAVTIQRGTGTWSTSEAVYWGDESGLEADLSAATAATINTIRQAVAVQHLLEADSRGGTRFREMILARWGIQTDDIRLMRPQLLATGSVRVDPTQVVQTFEAIGQALGEQASYAVSSQVGRGFVYSATEHCLVMGIVSARMDLAYQQNLERSLTKKTRYEYFYPELSQLGEQAILSHEIYTDGTGDPVLGTGDFAVWGYTPRYEEYRFRQNMITGQLRSDYALSLDVWHGAIDFGTRPVLNNAFIEEDPPFVRLIAIPNLPHFLVDSFFKVTCVRLMPRYAKPGLLRF